MFISSGFNNYWTLSYSPIPWWVRSSLAFTFFQNKHLLLSLPKLDNCYKICMEYPAQPHTWQFYPLPSKLLIVFCLLLWSLLYKSSREWQWRKSMWCLLKRTWRQVSPSEHKGFELAPFCSVSAVWWGVASHLLVYIGGCSPPVVTDKQHGIPSLRDWIVCKAISVQSSLSFSPTSVALCGQQFLLFTKKYYFGLLLQFSCSL